MYKIYYYISVAFERRVLKRTLFIALVVGVILNIINQNEVIFNGEFLQLNILQAILTFLVPFLVATYSTTLSRLKFIPGEIASIDAYLVCAHSGEEIYVKQGDYIPACKVCRKKTKWRLSSENMKNIKRYEEELQSMALFAHLNPAPVFRLNRKGTVLEANQAFTEIFGSTTVVGHTIDKQLNAFKALNIASIIENDEIENIELTLQKQYYSFTLKGNKEAGICNVYGNNITARKKAEQDLASMALFAKLNPEPVFRICPQGKILEANPAAQVVFNSENLINKQASEEITKLKQFNLKQIISEGEIHIIEETVSDKIYRFIIRGIPSYDIVQVYGSDISKRRKAEEMVIMQKESITDSIRYASRIQKAALISQENIGNFLPEHFIINKPRDIVSGDFYWINKVNNHIYIIAADCTGHGVPGAFMSMLGITLLNEIITQNYVQDSAEVLNKLRSNIKKTLHQSNDSNTSKDGMDISLAIIDTETNTLQFSGAFNPLYIVRDNELTELKANRMPIGPHPKENEPFSAQKLTLKDNDLLYLFSDGFIDQFGGEKGKKFKSKNFKQLLLDINQNKIDKQKEIIEDTFMQWKKELSQVDDVLIIGVKFVSL